MVVSKGRTLGVSVLNDLHPRGVVLVTTIVRALGLLVVGLSRGHRRVLRQRIDIRRLLRSCSATLIVFKFLWIGRRGIGNRLIHVDIIGVITINNPCLFSSQGVDDTLDDVSPLLCREISFPFLLQVKNIGNGLVLSSLVLNNSLDARYLVIVGEDGVSLLRLQAVDEQFGHLKERADGQRFHLHVSKVVEIPACHSRHEIG